MGSLLSDLPRASALPIARTSANRQIRPVTYWFADQASLGPFMALGGADSFFSCP
jgi:hypothetical protein